MNNIILIGMPGAGKSTLGVILAKVQDMKFIDTDITLQENTGRLLQEIIDTDGSEAFKKIEEETIIGLHCHETVIATGGSVVFSERAMDHLKAEGTIIYLRISYEEMSQRLGDIKTRGIVLGAGETLQDMYTKRVVLYEKYADITIDCSHENFETCVKKIMDKL